MNVFKKTSLAVCVNAAILASVSVVSTSALAQENANVADVVGVEVIEVTARKRTENIKDVPISVSALTPKKLEVLGSSGMDVRALSGKVPSLLIESSFGRTFPRFYIRGLGNTDFDLLASQPVSLIYDDVVLENALTKGMPMFDIERVEVLRGPQGTLFGRNTPAGIVKVQSKKPTQDFDANISGSYGSFGSTDFRVAIGGGLTDTLSARIALLQQDRDDWIDNKAPGFEQKDQLGGYAESAGRVQLLWEPNDDFSALFNYHFRDAEADARVFRANIIKPGTNDLVDDFDRETVFHDAAVRNNQTVDMKGTSLKIEYNMGNHTLTSVTGYESAEMFSVGDIDGGYGAAFLPDYMGPGFIPFPSETGARMPSHKQVTQEVRIASNDIGKIDYQFGFFTFDEDLIINNLSFNTLGGGVQDGIAIQKMETKAWAMFGSIDFEVTEKLNINAGLRYSDDERKWQGELVQSPFGAPSFSESNNVADTQISGDLSANYVLNDETNLYARLARGYRAPSIQGRSLLFSANSTTADSELVDSVETGFKSVFLENTARVDGSVYYYIVSDQQLTAVGGTGNVASLLNADKSVGYGFEIDSEYFITPDLALTASVSYNHTELQDDTVAVPGCGGGCTVTDPLNGDGLAMIDGNSLPQSPEWISNFAARWTKEVGDGEIYVYTDWSYRSEVNFFLYESIEFTGDALLEGGVRVGYEWYSDGAEYEVALFGRNITDEEQLTGAIDFNNLTGYVNEPRFWGVEFKANFF
ncbi:TonB-dependent receptor [Cognaticolwellia beringensis]|uniref:TonB-dependent receptor n=1 Tax=Cognaticolwellia beringensis TaxID=1967665 RepID=A0A222GCD8_9GAMM|nr:TonB-dependent receptor [Cognaticolwellia beringensis]ASP49539.1 TonB-dependent receptor [Cognaticolwellia beringensis]